MVTAVKMVERDVDSGSGNPVTQPTADDSLRSVNSQTLWQVRAQPSLHWKRNSKKELI